MVETPSTSRMRWETVASDQTWPPTSPRSIIDIPGYTFYPLHRRGFSFDIGRHLPVALGNVAGYDVGPDQRLDEPTDPAFARDPVEAVVHILIYGLLHIRRGGPVGHVGGHRSLRAGTAWRAAVSSTDDGQGVALRLLRGGGVLTPHRPASPRGHRLQGVGDSQLLPHVRTAPPYIV